MPAFAPVERPLFSLGGVALVNGEEVAVGELDDEAIWLAELVVVDNDVGVATAVVPIWVARLPKVVATVSSAREVMLMFGPETPSCFSLS